MRVLLRIDLHDKLAPSLDRMVYKHCTHSHVNISICIQPINGVIKWGILMSQKLEMNTNVAINITNINRR